MMREARVNKKRTNHFIRQFNKLIFNRFSLLLSGHRFSPWSWSIVVHVGRKTGSIYSTPIVAAFKRDRFFIPLPYEDDVDWLQNIMSRGSCKIKTGGKWHLAIDPQVIRADKALSNFPSILQKALRMHKVDKYLTMQHHSCLGK
jgi:hypothetical protein